MWWQICNDKRGEVQVEAGRAVMWMVTRGILYQGMYSCRQGPIKAMMMLKVTNIV